MARIQAVIKFSRKNTSASSQDAEQEAQWFEIMARVRKPSKCADSIRIIHVIPRSGKEDSSTRKSRCRYV